MCVYVYIIPIIPSQGNVFLNINLNKLLKEKKNSSVGKAPGIKVYQIFYPCNSQFRAHKKRHAHYICKAEDTRRHGSYGSMHISRLLEQVKFVFQRRNLKYIPTTVRNNEKKISQNTGEKLDVVGNYFKDNILGELLLEFQLTHMRSDQKRK